MQKIISAVRSCELKNMIAKVAIFSILFTVSFFYQPLVFVVGIILAVLIIAEYNYKSIIHIFFFSAWLFNYMIAVFFIVALVYMCAMTIKYCVETKNLFPVFVLPLVLIVIASFPGERIAWLLIMAYTTAIVVLRGREIGFSRLVHFFVFGILASAAVGMFRYIGWPSKFIYPLPHTDLMRFAGLCRSPNVFYLFVICALCALFYMSIKSKKIIWPHVPLIAVFTALGFMTMSRGFYIAFFVTGLFYGTLFILTFKKKGILVSLIACATVIVGALAVLPFTMEGLSRVTSSDTEFANETNLEAATDKYYDPGRLGIWKKNLREWVSSPKTFFLGHGITAPDIWDIGEHNTIIHILSKTGLVGLLLAILFFVLIFYILFRVLKLKFHVLSLGFLLSCLACGLTEEMFPKFHFFMFLYMFILASINRGAENDI